MHFFLVSTYVIGFLMLASSAIILPIRTRHAITSMTQSITELNSWKVTEQRRRESDISKAQHMTEEYKSHLIGRVGPYMDKWYREEADAIDVPVSLGLTFSRDESKTIASTVRHIGRANKPTAFLALLGGLISTAASVISVFA